jgi:hypothetical protein
MILIDKWAGLVTNASPYVLPPGAAVTQVNIQALIPGQLRVRPGTAAVSFAALSAGTSPIRSAMRYPVRNSVIYQDAAGNIRVGTEAS